MADLLKKKNIEIVKFDSDNIDKQFDHLGDFKELILRNEDMYPNIDKWYKNKVLPGLKTSERTAFMAYQDGKPVVSAVVKRGDNSKFCHLRIEDGLQNSHLGELFFALMALEVKKLSKEIHFTLPEGLWEEKKGFFESFGFKMKAKSSNQYRLFADELLCSADTKIVIRNAEIKMPKLLKTFSLEGWDSDPSILLSIHPEYAHKIIKGEKRVEIRRVFSNEWFNKKAVIYSTSPDRALLGEARISNIVKAHPEIIWAKFGDKIGCTKEEFDNYSNGSQKVFAIFFSEICPYFAPVFVPQLPNLSYGVLRPPQSYCILKNNKRWSEAVSYAKARHGGKIKAKQI